MYMVQFLNARYHIACITEGFAQRKDTRLNKRTKRPHISYMYFVLHVRLWNHFWKL